MICIALKTKLSTSSSKPNYLKIPTLTFSNRLELRSNKNFLMLVYGRQLLFKLLDFIADQKLLLAGCLNHRPLSKSQGLVLNLKQILVADVFRKINTKQNHHFKQLLINLVLH